MMDIEVFSESFQAPRIVLSFSGPPDAGKIVQLTLAELRKALPWDPLAIWDLDGYWTTKSARPRVRVHHGQIQRMEWPSMHFFSATLPSSEPVLFGTGPEPAGHWRPFTHELLKLLETWKCEEIVLLGSLYDHVFHDEVLISSVVQDVRSFNLVRDLGCKPADYEGRGAIHSAIMEEAHDRGFQCFALWSHLPFYLNGPHEMVISRLLEMLGQLLGLRVETDHLLESWKVREQEIEELIQQDPELRDMLEFMKQENALPEPSPESTKVIRLDEFLKRRQGLGPHRD